MTEREVAVLVRVASGATNVRIAHDLHVSQSTVRQHLTSLFRRFGVPSRGALVARAAHVGLLDVATWPPTATPLRCVARPPVAGGAVGDAALGGGVTGGGVTGGAALAPAQRAGSNPAA